MSDPPPAYQPQQQGQQQQPVQGQQPQPVYYQPQQQGQQQPVKGQQPQTVYYQPQQQGQQQPDHLITITQSASITPTVRQGRLLGSGIALLVLGILVLIVSCIQFIGLFGYAIWGGGLYIAAGALSIAASRQPTQCLVTATMTVSIIASVLAGIATLVYLLLFIAALSSGIVFVIVIFCVIFVFSVVVFSLATDIACTTCRGQCCK